MPARDVRIQQPNITGPARDDDVLQPRPIGLLDSHDAARRSVASPSAGDDVGAPERNGGVRSGPCRREGFGRHRSVFGHVCGGGWLKGKSVEVAERSGPRGLVRLLLGVDAGVLGLPDAVGFGHGVAVAGVRATRAVAVAERVVVPIGAGELDVPGVAALAAGYVAGAEAGATAFRNRHGVGEVQRHLARARAAWTFDDT